MIWDTMPGITKFFEWLGTQPAAWQLLFWIVLISGLITSCVMVYQNIRQIRKD